MIRITVIFLVTSIFVYSSETDWTQWHKEKIDQIEAATKLTDQERIAFLSPFIWFGPKELRGSQQEELRLAIYSKARSALLNTPGYADYFNKRIREPHNEFKNPPSERYTNAAGRYLDEMGKGTKTLQQLPSPETVKVLGEMLSDEWVTPVNPGLGESSIPSLADCAYHPLSYLPIVDSPIPQHYMQLNEGDQLKIWQAWYAEIKSGQRALAFKGEPREYRFKPDGTWDTIQTSLPPEEEVTKAPISVIPVAVVAASQSSQRTWLWITSVSALFVTLVGWLVRKKVDSLIGAKIPRKK